MGENEDLLSLAKQQQEKTLSKQKEVENCIIYDFGVIIGVDFSKCSFGMKSEASINKFFKFLKESKNSRTLSKDGILEPNYEKFVDILIEIKGNKEFKSFIKLFAPYIAKSMKYAGFLTKNEMVENKIEFTTLKNNKQLEYRYFATIFYDVCERYNEPFKSKFYATVGQAGTVYCEHMFPQTEFDKNINNVK